FNEEYNALRELLAAQEDSAAVLFRGCDPEAFQTNVSTNKEKVEVWKQTGVTTRSPVATDFELAKRYFQGFNEMLEFLIRNKREDMNWVPSVGQQQELRQDLENYIDLIKRENSIISSVNKAIGDYVETLGQLSEDTVQSELLKLKKSKARHAQEVVELVTKRDALTEQLVENRTETEKSREDERSEMN